MAHTMNYSLSTAFIESYGMHKLVGFYDRRAEKQRAKIFYSAIILAEVNL
jgi:hypothetical protein